MYRMWRLSLLSDVTVSTVSGITKIKICKPPIHLKLTEGVKVDNFAIWADKKKKVLSVKPCISCACVPPKALKLSAIQSFVSVHLVPCSNNERLFSFSVSGPAGFVTPQGYRVYLSLCVVQRFRASETFMFKRWAPEPWSFKWCQTANKVEKICDQWRIRQYRRYVKQHDSILHAVQWKDCHLYVSLHVVAVQFDKVNVKRTSVIIGKQSKYQWNRMCQSHLEMRVIQHAEANYYIMPLLQVLANRNKLTLIYTVERAINSSLLLNWSSVLSLSPHWFISSSLTNIYTHLTELEPKHWVKLTA